MANEEQLAILRKGAEAWNEWRERNPSVRPILTETNLSWLYADELNLAGANLWRTNLHTARLYKVNLSGADLVGADLTEADLTGANLEGANLHRADLSGAQLSEANLVGATLSWASLVDAKLYGTQLHGCRVYGTAIWDVHLDDKTSQRDLIITPNLEEAITVDDLEVAQFVYLLLENKRVRQVIDTITSKVVLILGRFTEERKTVLDALRDVLRRRDFTPILFDFDKPESRDLTETVSTLAHLACFVIADITDAKSIPQELMKIVPNLPSLPVRPIILDGQYEYAMFKDFGGYLSVLPPWRYKDTDHLLASLETEVIGPALSKAQQIEERRKAFEQELVNG